MHAQDGGNGLFLIPHKSTVAHTPTDEVSVVSRCLVCKLIYCMALCWPIKAAIRGYSETEAAKLTALERRRRTTQRVGIVAKAVYISVQLLCLAILLQSDSTLGQNWRSSQATFAWSFLALTCVNFVLYLALCTSNPGYLPLPIADEESVALNSKTHSDQPHLDRDEDTPIRVQPLPYPTNHANYINLAALGRAPASEARAEVPWWNLPRPGQSSVITQQQGHYLYRPCFRK